MYAFTIKKTTISKTPETVRVYFCTHYSSEHGDVRKDRGTGT